MLCYDGDGISEAEYEVLREDLNRWPEVSDWPDAEDLDDWGLSTYPDDDAPAEAEPTGPSAEDAAWWAAASNAECDRELVAA